MVKAAIEPVLDERRTRGESIPPTARPQPTAVTAKTAMSATARIFITVNGTFPLAAIKDKFVDQISRVI